MASSIKLKGGTGALAELRARGSMPYADLVEVAAGLAKGDRYRARLTLEELRRRGAFAVEGDGATSGLSGEYAAILERLEAGPTLPSDLAAGLGTTVRHVLSVLEDLESMGLARRYPMVKGKKMWVSADVDVARNLVETHRDAIVAMTSSAPM